MPSRHKQKMSRTTARAIGANVDAGNRLSGERIQLLLALHARPSISTTGARESRRWYLKRYEENFNSRDTGGTTRTPLDFLITQFELDVSH